MTLLEEYRLRPSPVSPAAFSAYITGATILHLYDPDPRARRSYSERRFWPAQATALAQRHYAPFWSLNCFHNGERKERCFAYMLAVGVDIDCATTEEFKIIERQDLDSRKNAVLLKLHALGIKPHMVNETPKGLHIVFFVERRTGPEGLCLYNEIMPFLVSYFGADDAAALVTQVLRFPNSLHQKNPQNPSLCVCLIDRLSMPPYNPEALLALLQERCPPPSPRQRRSHPRSAPTGRRGLPSVSIPAVLLSRTRLRIPARKWQVAMQGVVEGCRNDAAASVAGMLLRRYNRAEWRTLAWSAFRDWNERNRPPLDEPELWSVFEKIGRTVEAESQTTQPAHRVRVRCAPPTKNVMSFSSTSPTQL